MDNQDISWKIIMYFIQYLRDPINAINFIFDHFDRLYRENLADRIEQCLFFVIFVSRIYVIKCQKCPNVAFYRFCVVRLVVVVGTIFFFTFFSPLGNPASPGLLAYVWARRSFAFHAFVWNDFMEQR